MLGGHTLKSSHNSHIGEHLKCSCQEMYTELEEVEEAWNIVTP
jgi:hypothetical protein